MMQLDFIVPVVAILAWDVGRRFAEARSNRALALRIAALEGADATPRLTKLGEDLTAVKNQIETMRSRAGSSSRWGA